MAVKYEELRDKLYNTPLTADELKEVDEVEKMIDALIIEKYKGDTVYIDLSLVDFSYKNGKPSTTPRPRQRLQYRELQNRYESAGWITNTQDDGGMGGAYWVLTGKIK